MLNSYQPACAWTPRARTTKCVKYIYKFEIERVCSETLTFLSGRCLWCIYTSRYNGRRLCFAGRPEMANPINAWYTSARGGTFERVTIKPNTARASGDEAISLIKRTVALFVGRRLYAFEYYDRTHYAFRSGCSPRQRNLNAATYACVYVRARSAFIIMPW